MTTPKKKLIEVALPLDAINRASAREKSIRHGHPSTLHLWWARRPLATARAVVFAQCVDDPSAHPDIFPTARAQDKERQRLFKLLEQLVQWESTDDPRVLQSAQDAIWQSWRAACAEHVDDPNARQLYNRSKLPGFHDPFAGGGAIPLEAQRLGFEVVASDLNPVAVTINKAMIEYPPKFSGNPPVYPGAAGVAKSGAWRGSSGLSEDVRRYGAWLQSEAKSRLSKLYPKVKITADMARARPDLRALVGEEVTVIAWVWARTVKSPNPAFGGVDVPLVSSFLLATKPGKEVYIEPVVERAGYRFVVRVGKPADVEAVGNGTKLARGANFRCIMSGAPIAPDYIYAEANAGRMGARLMAMVAEGHRGRIYLDPTADQEAACRATAEWRPDVAMPENPRWFSPPLYGLQTYGDIYTERQLCLLGTFCSLLGEARERVLTDAKAAGSVRGKGSIDPVAYSDAVTTYLAFVLEKLSEAHSTLCTWSSAPKNELVVSTFRRQAVPMTWDFAEANPFADSSGSIAKTVEAVARVVAMALSGASPGRAEQADAATQELTGCRIVSTDPPYYDNIGYADLSDYFYVWLRRSLQSVTPDLFTTLAVPKAAELVATPYRHGGKEKAESFFLEGMTEAMRRIAAQAHPAYPITIYYAFKQTESESDVGTSSTGWETFLDAVTQAGFSVTGTWPMRTERSARSVGIGTNALASSIILACRRRPKEAPVATRREFVTALKEELPRALAQLQRGNIAPVDLAQAAIGPGMAVFTRFEKVLDAEGKALRMRDALSLINQTLDEALAAQEGDFDADSRWALAWFEQSGFSEGEYGVAETLSKAKNTSVKGLEEAGILKSSKGKVRLLRAEELPPDWDPATDERLTAWELVHQLIRALAGGGELGAAALASKLGSKAEVARELAYRLYTVCERKRRSAEALAYNGLVQSWPEISRLAREGGGSPKTAQGTLFGKDEE